MAKRHDTKRNIHDICITGLGKNKENYIPILKITSKIFTTLSEYLKKHINLVVLKIIFKNFHLVSDNHLTDMNYWLGNTALE